MLRIQKLCKTFWQGNDEVAVVDNISFAVKKGQIFGFLGPNGAGKTTTVKMIVGLLRPDSGNITIGKLSSNSLEARRRLGFMPENPQFYNHLRAREVLEFVGALFGLDNEVIKDRAALLLKRVGLTKFGGLFVRQFSKGMHQRLAFAVALMNEPELLILDEPLDGLDPLGRLDFKRLLLGLNSQGATVFFSSHILSDVEELADEVAIINRGRIIAQGSPKKLSGAKTLEAMFVEKVRADG